MQLPTHCAYLSSYFRIMRPMSETYQSKRERWQRLREALPEGLRGHVSLRNIEAVLACADSRMSDIARMTWYVVDLDEYRRERRAIGAAYREVMGDHYPAMTLVQVAALLEPGARVEIEATAVIRAR